MADDKSGRDEQASNEAQRQRERALAEELERMDELEPEIEPTDLVALEAELDALSFPASGTDIVATVGDHELTAADEHVAVGDLVPETEATLFDSPESVRAQVQRPTVAAELTRIVEAADAAGAVEFGTSQQEAYLKTLTALRALDPGDDDEPIREISRWILDQITEKGKLPGSRAVRREGGKIARKHGYEVSNNDWLGI
jgi:hypothetical protein